MEVDKGEANEDLRFVFGKLFDQFGWTLSKRDLSKVISCSSAQIDNMMKSGASPRFLKRGDGEKSSVFFPTYYVAKYLCENKTMNDYKKN